MTLRGRRYRSAVSMVRDYLAPAELAAGASWSGRDRLRFDLELDLTPDQHPAGLQSAVPDQAELLPVDARPGLERHLRNALFVRGLPQELQVQRHRPGHTFQCEVPGHPGAGGAANL